MTEYWKSVGNYYCDYCKVFVRNDAFSRKQHEASPRHENSLKRQVRNIHRNSERESRELAQANRELARIGGKTAVPTKQVDEGPRRVNIGTRPKKVEAAPTLDDQEVYRAALAAQALPGQWASTRKDDGQEPLEDLPGTEASEDEEEDDKKSENIIDWTEPRPEPPDEEHAKSALKRRRDGADEELMTFSVQQKKLAPAGDEDEDEDGRAGEEPPVIAFKRKLKAKAKAKVGASKARKRSSSS